jgi:tripartite-type tricarboxylate transporter receptor subunit TctC
MYCKYFVAFGQEQWKVSGNATRQATMPLLSAFLLFIVSTIAAPAHAQSTPFYQGKTIRIVVGTTSGSLYERWAQVLVRTMPKYIPGRPNMIVQNMPGIIGIVAANYGYTVAAPDGSTLVMFHRHVYLEQLIERNEVKFDLRRFNWIGSPDKSLPLLYIRLSLQIRGRHPEVRRPAQMRSDQQE